MWCLYDLVNKTFNSSRFNSSGCTFVEYRWRQCICTDPCNFFLLTLLGVNIATHSAQLWEFPSIPFEENVKVTEVEQSYSAKMFKGNKKKVIDLKCLYPPGVSVLPLNWGSLFFFFQITLQMWKLSKLAPFSIKVYVTDRE